MPTLLMLKGLPASGKSTYAKTLVKKGYKRVNKDDLRAMLDDSEWSKGNEKFVLKVRDYIVHEALFAGKDVVVDDTNFNPDHQQDLEEMAQGHQANFKIKFFDTPLRECIKRDSLRANSVGSKVIMQMYNQYLKPTAPIYVPSPGAYKAVICDIDGTLAHLDGRSPYDESKVIEDGLDPVVANLLDTMADRQYKILLVSGRHDSCRADTEKWLEYNHVYFDELLMRKAGDDRKDWLIKYEIFNEKIKDKYAIEFVLDDRDQVVNMWRNQLGLKVLQVAEGSF